MQTYKSLLSFRTEAPSKCELALGIQARSCASMFLRMQMKRPLKLDRRIIHDRERADVLGLHLKVFDGYWAAEAQ